jgi:homoserine kinase
MRARAFAPASVANLGVGFDALGAALDGPGDLVTAEKTRSRGVVVVAITGDGGRLPRDPEKNTAAVAAREVLRLCGARFGLALTVAKGLPLESGLGSSAASAAAGAMAAAAICGIAGKRRLLRAVLLAEHAADGSWHSDNAFASLLGGLLLVPGSRPGSVVRSIPLPVPERLRLVLAVPALRLATSVSRSVLPADVPLGVHVAHAAALASLVDALHRGDLARVGRCVGSDRIVERARAPLVRGHAAVTAAMRRAGALGCALAGAGPSILAVVDGDGAGAEVGRAAESAWRAAGVACHARVHRVDPEGARLLS